jgi:hypothetical protein
MNFKVTCDYQVFLAQIKKAGVLEIERKLFYFKKGAMLFYFLLAFWSH